MLAAYVRLAGARSETCTLFTTSFTRPLFNTTSSQLRDLHNISSRPPDNHGELDRTQDVASDLVARNPLGVQLLPRTLRDQVFKGAAFPPPSPSTIQISRNHLKSHGLNTSEGSILPNVDFPLPPLQGANISEHFYRIGSLSAEPWLSLARNFASSELPPVPTTWQVKSGWTRYHYSSDGSLCCESVEAPGHGERPEDMLCFDVETMPTYHPYAILACAASPTAWYVWISPWLLEESTHPEHLIPLGHPDSPALIVGHNVSYDRIRTLEEYNVHASRTRFIDTMSLHVAVTGISSGQRPAWLKYHKLKDQKADETSGIVDAEEVEADGLVGDAATSQTWEDLTSVNALADVAKLHCGIDLRKEIRQDFMKLSPTQILDSISDYIGYCARDVSVTHQVYKSTLSNFLRSCPHPVSFAGVLTMGSAFLPVDSSWEAYIKQADGVYFEMQAKVEQKLKRLAEDALNLADDETKWREDPWLGQLDWTPKAVKQSRGNLPLNPSSEMSTDDFGPNTSLPQSGRVDSGVLEDPPELVSAADPDSQSKPVWYSQVTADKCSKAAFERIVPLILKFSCEGRNVQFNSTDGWHYVLDGRVVSIQRGKKSMTILTKSTSKLIRGGIIQSPYPDLALSVCEGNRTQTQAEIVHLADNILSLSHDEHHEDPWFSQLDWSTSTARKRKEKSPQPPALFWPKWYWEAAKPKKGCPPGTLEITGKGRLAPLLLRLSWEGYPLFYSREHGWTYRVPRDANFQTRSVLLDFFDPADVSLADASRSRDFRFYKVPHKDGEQHNVGSPLGKTFMKHAQNGTLTSAGDEATEAFDLNAVCSYWISVRDRVRSQLVVWQDSNRSLGLCRPSSSEKKYGIILPQVTTMGTVTRRAIEKTWLTASNAKPNRVGSELKAMVRAPEGYAIVGADVDSEELWIASLMGDAQFGLHGASAIGWMTLEGTKAAGTDLHSKTASILGITRDSAKVFNYSRIYGAGVGHARSLLLQANSSMKPEEAERLATNLYASTKGKSARHPDDLDRKFWHGGTESFLFNKLEEIALSEKPFTPALDCGITSALLKENLPKGYAANFMTSRVNWVVQSSGVDYLHLLIVAMGHLISKYDIQARYMISVHDELRYLVKEEDKYRAALALQIANLWTRSLFAYKLGMDDLPQSVAFFSAVDIDHVLRKEVDMPCVTPSQPIPIPPGESVDIYQVLAKTGGGSLWKDGRPMQTGNNKNNVGSMPGYVEPNCLSHRVNHPELLAAQAAQDWRQVRDIFEQAKRKEGKAQTKLERQGLELPTRRGLV